jgi:putative transposase
VKQRLTDEQRIGFLKQADAGVPANALCRQHGVSDAAFYPWSVKFGGMTLPAAQRLRHMKAENARIRIAAWRREDHAYRAHSAL